MMSTVIIIHLFKINSIILNLIPVFLAKVCTSFLNVQHKTFSIPYNDITPPFHRLLFADGEFIALRPLDSPVRGAFIL